MTYIVTDSLPDIAWTFFLTHGKQTEQAVLWQNEGKQEGRKNKKERKNEKKNASKKNKIQRQEQERK